MNMLEVRGLSKRFGDALVLDDLSLEAAAGEFLAVIGPSGCGKSTLLSCVAGLVDHDAGDVFVAGRRVTGPLAECAVVFQQSSLLPWRPVLRNVEYGLELADVGKHARRARARAAIEMVGLREFADHFPHELSGGMQQRVNLARALAMEPALLLMDEPFSALDALTRERLQDELTSLGDGRTVVFITHDVEEAVFLADRVVVMDTAPGQLRDVVRVPLPRPRTRADLTTPAIQELILRLRSMLAPKTEHDESESRREHHPIDQRLVG
jgi:NitT/TauT family transport system ATP-binding protein